MSIKINLLIFLFTTFLFSQNKNEIDSINAIPFEIKISQASFLDYIFVENAKNARELKYAFGEAESYSNLSLVYYMQGKYDLDFMYSLKAIEIFDKINALEKLAIEYGELGYRMKKRNLQKAQQFMLMGKNIAEKKKLEKPLLSIYNNYGVIKELQKQIDSAMYFYKKGLELKNKMNDSIGIPYSLNNIAGIYLLNGQYEKAKIFYDKALYIRALKNDTFGIVQNYTYLADVYFIEKNYTKAIDYYKIALHLSIKHHFADLIQHIYKKLSENYEQLNNLEEALSNFKKHEQFKDSLINKETNDKIAELEIYFETNKKEKLLLEKEMQIKNSKNKFFAVSSIAIILGLIALMIYRQQKLKNLQQKQEFELKSTIANIETQNKLQEQRLSISRDLHDNIGSQLTFIISTIDNLKLAHKILDTKILNQLNKISEFTKSTILDLRDTIWAMNAEEFKCEDLHSRILGFINKAKSTENKINFEFEIDEASKNINFSSFVGINLYRVIQEALNNAIKYAEAKNIHIAVSTTYQKLSIKIIDDGQGFDIEKINLGNGINNMIKRMEDIKGKFNIASIPNISTTIDLSLELN